MSPVIKRELLIEESKWYKFLSKVPSVSLFFISAVCSVLAARLCLLADDFERDRSSMSPPPWLVMAAIKDVV